MASPLLRHRSVLQHPPPQEPTLSGSSSSSSTLQFASSAYENDHHHTQAGTTSKPSSSSAMKSPSVGNYHSVFGTSLPYPRASSSRRLFMDDTDSYVGGWKQTVVLAVGILLLATPWIRHSSMVWKVRTLQQELAVLQRDQRRLQSRLGMQTDTLQRVKADVDEHKKKNDVLLGELKTHGDNFEDFDSEHYKAAEAIENEYFLRVAALETEIQRSSQRRLARHGYGVLGKQDAIRLEIILSNDVSTFGNKLMMELGPVHHLGHAIDLFLMLAEHKHFYDHLTLMHRSAGSNVINTVPMDSETMQVVSNNFVRGGHPLVGSPEASQPVDLKLEDEFMLQQLAMLEQTDEYPVQKYSVIFADKGPHFYINMEDKVNIKKGGLRETCFGRIVEGHEILDYMSSHHEKNFRGMSMVGIETIRVVKTADDGKVKLIDPRLPPPSKKKPSISVAQ